MKQEKHITSNSGRTYLLEPHSHQDGSLLLSQRATLLDTGEVFFLRSLPLTESLRSPEFLKKVSDTAHRLQSLDHPYILKQTDYIETESKLHFVYQVPNGISLQEYAQKHTTSEQRALELLLQLVEGISVTQKHQITHGNLFPENVFVDKDEVKIVDFGLSEVSLLSSEKDVVYLPPEKVLKKGLKENSDVYSLGALYYFFFNCKSPYSYADLIELQMRQKECSPDSSKLSQNTSSLIKHMLCFRAQERLSLQGLLTELQTSLCSFSNINEDKKKMANSVDPNSLDGKHKKGLQPQGSMTILKENNKFGTSITTVHSILHDFEDSHVSGVHEKPEQQLLNEQAFPKELGAYLFEKNLIIFLIDAAKKAKLCEENLTFAEISRLLLEAQLLTIQKATALGERVLQSMQKGENIFQLSNFGTVSKTKAFQQLLRFFDDFQEFIQKYLDETLYHYSLDDESLNVKQIL